MTDLREQPIYVFAGFHLDTQRRVLSHNGAVIQLTPKTVDTLIHLVAHRGDVLEKRALLKAVWPHAVVEENNLNQAISALRRALGEQPGEHRFIVTEPGRGYRFVATVATLPQPLAPAAGTEPYVADDRSTGRAKTKSQGTPLYASAALLALVLGAGLSYLMQDDDAALPNSVAVLPFKNLSANPDDAFFALGLHAEILTQLTKVSALNVIALPSVLRYVDTEMSVPEIAAELKVQTLLFADVRYADDSVRITPQLVDGETGEVLYIDTFDRPFKDIFALESDIATAVVDALSAQLLPSEQASIDKVPTDSAEAYRAYLNAQAVLGRSGTRYARLTIDYLDAALQHDPKFAEAHALKAEVYAGSLISQFGHAPTASERDAQVHFAREAADKALLLDVHNWVARNALVQIHLYSWRWTEAREEYERAARSVPRVPRHSVYALVTAMTQEEFEDAIREQRRVIALNPSIGMEHWWLGVLYTYSGDPRAAAAAIRGAIDLEAGFGLWHVWLAYAEGLAGNAAAALAELESAEELPQVHDSPVSIAMLAYAYARNGRPDEAARLVGLLETRAPDRRFEAGNWALAYLALGDAERARASLETVVDKIAQEEPDSGFWALRHIRLNLFNDPLLDQEPFVHLRDQLRGR